MNNSKSDPLDETTEKVPRVMKGEESAGKTTSSDLPADSGTTEPATKSKIKRSRKPKSKPGASQKENKNPAISRSLHLSRLNPIEMGIMLLISLLNACQIPGRTLDPERVRLYREMLDTQFPPNIIVIRDRNEKYYIASGHHRVAAALAAGRLEVKCDVYEGTEADAIIVGGEENQGPASMSLAAKKSLLETLLSLGDGQKYTVGELVSMTGLERHTIAKYMDDRNAGGNFIAVAGKMKQGKSPEEQRCDAAKGMVRNITKHGVEVVTKALELLQPHLREEVLSKILPKNES